MAFVWSHEGVIFVCMQVVRNHHDLYRDILQYGMLSVVELEKAGHWLHVDNPSGLEAMMQEGILLDLKK